MSVIKTHPHIELSPFHNLLQHWQISFQRTSGIDNGAKPGLSDGFESTTWGTRNNVSSRLELGSPKVGLMYLGNHCTHNGQSLVHFMSICYRGDDISLYLAEERELDNVGNCVAQVVHAVGYRNDRRYSAGHLCSPEKGVPCAVRYHA